MAIVTLMDEKHIRVESVDISDIASLRDRINCDTTVEIRLLRDLSDLNYLYKKVDHIENLIINTSTALETLDEIKFLTDLKYLYIRNCKNFYDLTAVQNFKNLCRFEVHETSVKDILPIEKLKNLMFLTITNNKIESIKSLFLLDKLYYSYVEEHYLKSTGNFPDSLDKIEKMYIDIGRLQIHLKNDRHISVGPYTNVQDDYFYRMNANTESGILL